MPEKDRIIKTLQEAILTHQDNIAKAELDAAKGDNNVVATAKTVAHGEREIVRLEAMLESLVNGTRVTSESRMANLSAQIGVVRGELLSVAEVLSGVNGKLDHNTELLGQHGVILTSLRDECPLFQENMPEGPLYFKKPPSDPGA